MQRASPARFCFCRRDCAGPRSERVIVQDVEADLKSATQKKNFKRSTFVRPMPGAQEQASAPAGLERLFDPPHEAMFLGDSRPGACRKEQ